MSFLNKFLSKLMENEDREEFNQNSKRYVVDTWFERDRAHVSLKDANGTEIADWWDDDVHQLVDDGYFNPKDWEGSTIAYAREMGLIESISDGSELVPDNPLVVFSTEGKSPVVKSFRDAESLLRKIYDDGTVDLYLMQLLNGKPLKMVIKGTTVLVRLKTITEGKDVDIGDGYSVSKVGKDVNGNSSYWVKKNGKRAKKVQHVGNINHNKAHNKKDLAKDTELHKKIKDHHKTYNEK